MIAGDGQPQAVRRATRARLDASRACRGAAGRQRAALCRRATVPSAHIVPALADEGVYLASESGLARVLHAHDQSVHRRRAKAPQAGRLPATHIATAPRQMWCWDMTCLAAEVIG